MTSTGPEPSKTVAQWVAVGLVLCLAVLLASCRADAGATRDVVAATAEGSAPTPTGAGVPDGVSLQRSGDVVVEEAGTVVDGLHVEGYIHVRADDVTIIRSRVTYGGAHSIRVFPGAVGTRVVDTTVECVGPRTNGLVFGRYTAVRVEVTGCRNAFMSSAGGPAATLDCVVDGRAFDLGEEGATQRPSGPGQKVLAGPPPSDVSPRPAEATPDTEQRAVDGTESPSQPQPAAMPPAEQDAVSRAEVVAAAGPRADPTVWVTPEEAEARIADTGLLESVRVRGGLDLSQIVRPYLVREVVVDADGSRYGIRTSVGSGAAGPPEGEQVLQHVEVFGATSAGLYLGDVTVKHADVWGNIDNVKAADRVTLEHSWLHSQSWVEGAHADGIQIRYGVDQRYVRNVVDARYGSSEIAGERAGQPSNAGLQTGSMIRPASAVFFDNWWDGGHHTVRLGDSGPPLIDYQFRGNRFGRAASYGPVTGSTSARSSFGGEFFDDSNVWDDTGRPVD